MTGSGEMRLAASAPVTREAGRVLVIDPDGCVLLLKHRTEDGTVWAAPGGGCESGESPAEAAARELAEECGIAVETGIDTTAVHAESRRWHFDGIAYDQTDHYFVARVSSRPAVNSEGRTALEEANVLGDRWFSVSELQSCDTRFEPAGLIALLIGHQ
jgi:8-oxo-dGTP pyrophosphatase MutT (NUDIX family)